METKLENCLLESLLWNREVVKKLYFIEVYSIMPFG